jgi:hypothetical protein
MILCASVPSIISTPTTTVVANNVIFDWNAPSSNGIPISGYKVYIRKADMSYILDASVCDGLDLGVIAATKCTVPLAKLYSSPYNLLKGYSINIKVIATNRYGDSIISD